jgi:hypothetical protein
MEKSAVNTQLEQQSFFALPSLSMHPQQQQAGSSSSSRYLVWHIAGLTQGLMSSLGESNTAALDLAEKISCLLMNLSSILYTCSSASSRSEDGLLSSFQQYPSLLALSIDSAFSNDSIQSLDHDLNISPADIFFPSGVHTAYDDRDDLAYDTSSSIR